MFNLVLEWRGVLTNEKDYSILSPIKKERDPKGPLSSVTAAIRDISLDLS